MAPWTKRAAPEAPAPARLTDHTPVVVGLLALLLPLLLLWWGRRRRSTGGPPQKRLTSSPLSSTSLVALLSTNAKALSRMRAAFVGAGGVPDEFIDNFFLRFLVGNDGDEEAATRQLVSTTEWRKNSGTGAADFRAKVLAGTPLMELHPGIPMLFGHFPCLVGHGWAHDGGPLNIYVHDGFEPVALMEKLSAEDYRCAVTACLEVRTSRADLGDFLSPPFHDTAAHNLT